MTPIYASDRANVEGWYAYQPPVFSRRVFWDGGVGKRDQGATGFWCPYSGNIVDAPDKLIEAMPSVALDCAVEGNEVIVTGFPKVEYMSDVAGDELTEVDLDYLLADPIKTASFMDEIELGEELLEGTPCRLISVEKLPDDRDDALAYFREHYPYGVCRHPYSSWTPLRSVYMMANVKPETVREGRIREIFHSEGTEVIDYVTVWATIEKELKVLPLYHGDNEGDCQFWQPKQPITLYCVEDLVVGYE
jgi:hypothetical protein